MAQDDKYVNVKYIVINDGFQNIKVAVEKGFKRAYKKALKGQEKAELALRKAKNSAGFSKGGFRKYLAKNRALNAETYLNYKKQKLQLLEGELEKSSEEAKKNPYEQEFKLRYPSITETKDIVKYKRRRKKRKESSASIMVASGALLIATLVTGGIALPIILGIGIAVLGYTYAKNRRELKRFENLEMQKTDYEKHQKEEVQEVTYNNQNNLQTLSVTPSQSSENTPNPPPIKPAYKVATTTRRGFKP